MNAALRRFGGRSADLRLGAEVQAVFAEVVGPLLSANLVPVGVHRGELFLGALSSVWVMEAGFLAGRIRDGINTRLGRSRIERVIIRLLKEAPQAALLTHAPPPDEPPQLRAVSDDERASINRAVAAVDDERLRETLRRVLMRAVQTGRAGGG